jgi:broad specificity phosphatase PhoE
VTAVIHVVRHGETDANAARIVQLPDAPLSARGRAQAERVARRLAAAPVGLILASDLRRAVETAEAVARASGAPLELDPDLAERNYGDVRGTAYADLDVDIFGPDYVPPGGETWEVFDRRVDAVWARVVARAAETRGDVVVVTHGLVCRGIALRHLVLPETAVVPLAWGNTAVTLVDGGRARLVGCTAHLADLPDDSGVV